MNLLRKITKNRMLSESYNFLKSVKYLVETASFHGTAVCIIKPKKTSIESSKGEGYSSLGPNPNQTVLKLAKS